MVSVKTQKRHAQIKSLRQRKEGALDLQRSAGGAEENREGELATR